MLQLQVLIFSLYLPHTLREEGAADSLWLVIRTYIFEEQKRISVRQPGSGDDSGCEVQLTRRDGWNFFIFCFKSAGINFHIFRKGDGWICSAINSSATRQQLKSFYWPGSPWTFCGNKQVHLILWVGQKLEKLFFFCSSFHEKTLAACHSFRVPAYRRILIGLVTLWPAESTLDFGAFHDWSAETGQTVAPTQTELEINSTAGLLKQRSQPLTAAGWMKDGPMLKTNYPLVALKKKPLLFSISCSLSENEWANFVQPGM